MENNKKIIDIIMGMTKGSGRRGRQSREWLDDIRYWCRREFKSRRQRNTRKYNLCIGHLWAFCPWILMMMMMTTTTKTLLLLMLLLLMMMMNVTVTMTMTITMTMMMMTMMMMTMMTMT